MNKRLNIVAVFALAACLLTISGCGKNDKANMNDTTKIMTGSEVTVIVETGSKTIIVESGSANTENIVVSKEVSYEVPSAQPASITVTATLDASKNIKSISINLKSSEEKTAGYQKAFSDNISTAVVGKSLSEAKVTQLAGSSLTSAAFNLAIDDLVTKA